MIEGFGGALVDAALPLPTQQAQKYGLALLT